MRKRRSGGAGDAAGKERKPAVFCYDVMCVLDQDSGPIHSVVATAANAHCLIPTAVLLYKDEQANNINTGCQGTAMKLDMASTQGEHRLPIRPRKLRGQLETLQAGRHDPD